MLQLSARKEQWFNVPQDPSGEAMVQIVHLKPGEVAQIEAQSNKITGKQTGESYHTEIDISFYDRTKLFVDRAIKDWKGFTGINGKPLKCTPENKLKVLKEFDWFGEFIEECRTTLQEQYDEDMEDAEKKLEDFSIWLSGVGRTSCDVCISVYGEGLTPCDTCKPVLKQCLAPYFELFYYCQDQAIMGPNGPYALDMLAVNQGMEDLKVPEDERIEFSVKARQIASTIFSARAEEIAEQMKSKK